MKTIVIWDQMGAEPIQFFILEGNKSHLDNVYLNAYSDDFKQNDLIQELDSLVYGEDGFEKVEWLDRFPNDQLGSSDLIIVAGFVP